MTITIDQEIVGVSVAEESAVPPVEIPMESVMQRPHALKGTTYKIKASGAYDEALYLTITNVETEYGLRPFELFLNSRAQESFQWIVLCTRLTSAIMRREASMRDYNTFWVDEFLAVVDPHKQYYSEHYRGKYMSSVVQEMGCILRDHLSSLGLMNPTVNPKEETMATVMEALDLEAPRPPPAPHGNCPDCRELLVLQDGCPTCTSCGWSKC